MLAFKLPQIHWLLLTSLNSFNLLAQLYNCSSVPVQGVYPAIMSRVIFLMAVY